MLSLFVLRMSLDNITDTFFQVLGMWTAIIGTVGVGAGTAIGIGYWFTKKISEEHPQIKSDVDSLLWDRHQFDDVKRDEIVGLDAIVERTNEFLYFLNDFKKVDPKIDIPRGSVLAGPPGVGKTFIARYLFSNLKGEVWEVREERRGDINQMYARARKRRDSTGKAVVLFRDEFDKVRVDEINRLLEQLSGINSARNRGVFFLGVANQIPTIDNGSQDFTNQSLYRPGRLEIIKFGYPNLDSKEKMLRMYLNRFVSVEGIDIKAIAAMMPENTSGAHIQDLVMKSVLSYASRGTPIENLANRDLIVALKHMIVGTPQETQATEEQRYQLAVHEAGHYVAAKHFGFKVPFLSIEHHFDSSGLVYLGPPDNSVPSSEYLESRIMVGMAGYLAEGMKGFKPNAGSLSDTESIHSFYRMLEQIRLKRLDPSRYSEQEKTRNGYHDIDKGNFKRYENLTKQLLQKNMVTLDKIADKLVETPTLTSMDISKI